MTESVSTTSKMTKVTSSNWFKSAVVGLVGLLGIGGGYVANSFNGVDFPLPGNDKFKSGVYYQVDDKHWIFIPTDTYYKLELGADGKYTIVEESGKDLNTN